MEKHTKEYAMLCAKLCSNQLSEELTPFELIIFETGYMKAIEETNVAGLLEALKKVKGELHYENEINGTRRCGKNWSNEIDLIDNAIKKATE
jgi:hypothetical protein